MTPDNARGELKPIPGYPGYYVSSAGDVWSYLPKLGGLKKWRNLKQSGHTSGYRVVGLRPEGERRMGGKVQTIYVHRLVMLAFVGPCPEGMMVCHWNGDPSDNRLENLRYGTNSENIQDAKRHGTFTCGSKSRNAVLTESHIPMIRALVRSGFGDTDIGKLCGVHREVIASVRRGRTWAHVADE